MSPLVSSTPLSPRNCLDRAASSCTWDRDFKAPVRPGDEITAKVEVLETREDKPLTKLRTTITNQDGATVLDGSALVWTEPV